MEKKFEKKSKFWKKLYLYFEFFKKLIASYFEKYTFYIIVTKNCYNENNKYENTVIIRHYRVIILTTLPIIYYILYFFYFLEITTIVTVLFKLITLYKVYIITESIIITEIIPVKSVHDVV